MVLPPVQCGQVGTQPCAQVVEEDHVEWDAHQGIEDTKDLPCLCTGCQVSVAYRAKECIDQGNRELRTTSHLPTPGPAEACPHHLWGKRCSLFPWILTRFSDRTTSAYRRLISNAVASLHKALLTATLCLPPVRFLPPHPYVFLITHSA